MIKYFFRLNFILIFVFTFFSCTKKKSPIGYINWVDNEDNGLVKIQQNNKSKITCKYTPSEYVVLKQFNPSDIDTSIFSSEVTAINNLYHFILRFENLDGSNFMKDNYTTAENFNMKSTYLSFDINKDLKLIIGEDTMSCALNHYERTYSNTPYEQVLIAFPKNESQIEDMTLIFNDRVFGFDRTKFFFSKNDLKNIPNLKL